VAPDAALLLPVTLAGGGKPVLTMGTERTRENTERTGKKMQRHIVHIDMDAFFVSVERSRDPSLAGRPVVVGGVEGTRGVVSSASYEARRYGIHSAMPVAAARKLCPQAVFLPGSYEVYLRVSRAIRRIFESWTPLVEMRSIDEACLDLTGFDRCYGPVLGTVDRILRQVRDTLGLDLSAGVASNKLVAKIATTVAKPAGILQVLPGCEEQFMARLALSAVPGVGGALDARLAALGLHTVGELQLLELPLLVRVFGKAAGSWLYRMARGRGGLKVETERPGPKSVGNSVTFSRDTVDRKFLEGVLYRLSEKVGGRVRRKGLEGGTVTLRLRYSDFKTVTRSSTIARGTNCDQEIFERALELMIPLLARRVRVRLLGVTLSRLRSSVDQLDLFDSRARLRRIGFYRSLDLLRAKYGFDSVRKGRALRLESFRTPSGYMPQKAG
jgi:DNA polymerase IV